LEVFVLPQFITFRRTSGRDLRAVRRPVKTVDKAAASKMKKADLVALAEAQGVDAEGTKADLVERLTTDESDG
jgi:hypothetical protein